MPFDTKTVASIDEIPNLILAFAGQCGFAINGAAFVLPSGVSVEVGAVHGQVYDTVYFAGTSAEGGATADVNSPQITGRDPFRSTPTELRLYGRSSGVPYLSAVIRYQFGEYRHLYAGTLERCGVYQGGEVIASANPDDIRVPAGRTMQQVGYISRSTAYMFQGNSGRPIASKGGMRIIHPKNASTWRTFGGPGLVFPSPLLGSCFGGFGDEINDPLLLHGTNGFAGGPELTPIPLYLTQPNGRFTCVGTPAGVRAANLVDLEPGAVVAVASDRWRVYPQWWRTNADQIAYDTPSGTIISGNGAQDGFPRVNSKWIGLAYQEA